MEMEREADGRIAAALHRPVVVKRDLIREAKLFRHTS